MVLGGGFMLIKTDRFGDLELEKVQIINFPSGLPGFEDLHDFLILDIEETKPIYWLQSVENKYISLPVVNPFEIFGDYSVDINDDDIAELNIDSQMDLQLVHVVVIPVDMTEMTANMVAPIVINSKLGIGKQTIIDSKDLLVRQPIYIDVMKTLIGGKSDAGSIEKER